MIYILTSIVSVSALPWPLKENYFTLNGKVTWKINFSSLSYPLVEIEHYFFIELKYF